jgi:hypothetical protein
MNKKGKNIIKYKRVSLLDIRKYSLTKKTLHAMLNLMFLYKIIQKIINVRAMKGRVIKEFMSREPR